MTIPGIDAIAAMSIVAADGRHPHRPRSPLITWSTPSDGGTNIKRRAPDQDVQS
ncbi:hypothetical protein ACFQ0O_17675 [Saccharopolyspora spinosporotrichia]